MLVTGGLARDEGLLDSVRRHLVNGALHAETHPDAIHAGSLGAALLAAYRWEQLARSGRLPASA